VLWGVTTRLRLARVMLITGTAAPGDPARLLAAGVDAVTIVNAQAGDAAVDAAVASWRRGVPDGHGLLGHEHAAGREVCPDADFVNTAAPCVVNKTANPYLLIGRTCTTTQRIDEALADADVDFLLVGDATGAGGAGLLRHAASVAPQTVPSSKPWFAVGGVNATNLPGVLAAGARRIAVSRAIAMAPDPYAAARALADTVHASWSDMDAVRVGAFGPSRRSSSEDGAKRPAD